MTAGPSSPLSEASRWMRSGRYLPKRVVQHAERWLLALPYIEDAHLEGVTRAVAGAQAADPRFRPIFLIPNACSPWALGEWRFQYETLFSREEAALAGDLDFDEYISVRIEETANVFTVSRVLVDVGSDGSRLIDDLGASTLWTPGGDRLAGGK